MKCPNCGETMKSKMNFCGFCGTNLRTGEKNVEPETKKVSNKPVFTSVSEAAAAPLKADPEIPKHDVPVSDNLPKMVSNTIIPDAQKEITPEPAVFKMPGNSTPANVKEISPPTPVPKEVEPPTPSSGLVPDIEAVDLTNEILISETEETEEPVNTAPEAPKSESKGIFADILKNAPSAPAQKDAKPDAAKEVTEEKQSKPASLFAALVENPEKAAELKQSEPSVPNSQMPDASVTAEPAPSVQEKRKVKVLDVIGQNKTTAEQKLKFLELSVDCEYVNDDSPKGTVLKQSIPFSTEVEIETPILLTVSVGTWCRWTTEPLIIDPNDSKYIIETKNQYRVRTRTRSMDYKESNTSPEMDGYKLYDTQKVYSEWVNDKFFVTEKKPLNDLCDILKKQIGYKYCGWFYNGADVKKAGTSFATPKLAVFFNKDTTEENWSYDEIIEHKDLSPNVVGWKPAEDNVENTPAGDSITNNVFISTYEMAGKAYAMKFGTTNGEWFKYKTRILEKSTYFFQKEIISEWSEWSDWDDTEIKGASDLKEIEKQTVSRYRRKSSEELKNQE